MSVVNGFLKKVLFGFVFYHLYLWVTPTPSFHTPIETIGVFGLWAAIMFFISRKLSSREVLPVLGDRVRLFDIGVPMSVDDIEGEVNRFHVFARKAALKVLVAASFVLLFVYSMFVDVDFLKAAIASIESASHAMRMESVNFLIWADLMWSWDGSYNFRSQMQRDASWNFNVVMVYFLVVSVMSLKHEASRWKGVLREYRLTQQNEVSGMSWKTDAVKKYAEEVDSMARPLTSFEYAEMKALDSKKS